MELNTFLEWNQHFNLKNLFLCCFVIFMFEASVANATFPESHVKTLRPFDLHKAHKMKQKFLWHLVLIEQKVLQGIEFLARLGKISQELPCVKILARKILWKLNSPLVKFPTHALHGRADCNNFRRILFLCRAYYCFQMCSSVSNFSILVDLFVKNHCTTVEIGCSSLGILGIIFMVKISVARSGVISLMPPPRRFSQSTKNKTHTHKQFEHQNVSCNVNSHEM